jgi:phage tail-like protein
VEGFMASQNPVPVFKYGLEAEGMLQGYFTEISGIDSETEIVETRSVNPFTYEIILEKFPGQTTWNDITLKRGVTSNRDIWEWRQKVIDDVEDPRINCSIIAYNQENEEVARWDLLNAWPSKVTGPKMDAGGIGYMVEEITIVHDGVTRVEAA